jgi:hypothetical protein
MANNILKEAIADAKAVRQVALANAKAALEEAFTPKLQSMLSARLSEELEDDYDVDMEGTMTYEDDEDLEMGENYGEEDSMDEEINLEDILNELELEGDEEEDLEEVTRVGQPNYKGDDVHDILNRASDVNDNLSENFNLDSLLKEINDLEDDEEIMEVYDDEMGMIKHSGCGSNMMMNNEGQCMEMDMDMDDMDMDEMHMDDMDMNMNMNKGMSTDDMMNMMETKKGGCGCKKENIQLQETKRAYNTIKAELNEVNLLNSKLLYVNRIFKANNLSEAQKLRVVETLDNATNIKEAKLIYETIKDTFNVVKTTQTNPKRPIRENFGMASKATLTSAPRNLILNESNDMVTRMQKLANISKIK